MADWYIGGGGESTNEPNYLTIRVYDACAPTLGPIKKRRWRTLRDDALAEWSASGLRFLIEEKEFTWPINGTEYDDMAFLEDVDRASIILKRGGEDMTRSTGNYTDQYGSTGPDYALGLATYEGKLFTRAYLGENKNIARAIVAHEIGHCLGFGHGGSGVMGYGYFPEGSVHVSQEEIQIAREWYQL